MAEARGIKGRQSRNFWWMKRAVGLEGDLGKKECGHGKLSPPTGKKRTVSFSWSG